VLAAVYCFNTGHADQPTNQFDQATSSAQVKVKKTECIFAELPQGSAPSGGGTRTTPRTTPQTTPPTTPKTTPQTQLDEDGPIPCPECTTGSAPPQS